jgi:uncharacterized protein YdaU (DUF1376 family)
MNYYPHHIGDFNNATRHLTRIERSIYRDLIELYYDTEQPLILDMKALCRKILARTDDESTAVEQVLNEFFTQTEQGWYHKRCEEVMQEYRDNISAKSAAGKASAAKREAERLAKLNGSSTDVQQPLNGCATDVQLTNNQEPITKNQVNTAPAAKSPKPSKKNKTPLPADFAISDRVKVWAKGKGHDRLDLHFENFLSACRKAGYTYVDWDEAFMDAIRKDWAKIRQPQTGGFFSAPPPLGSPSRPILSPEQQVPGLAVRKGRRPEGLGPLKSLLRHQPTAAE